MRRIASSTSRPRRPDKRRADQFLHVGEIAMMLARRTLGQ
jgi:hypothetical protein